MQIENKYIKLIGKHIYYKPLDKFGYICSIEINRSIEGGGYFVFRAFFDRFHDNHALFPEKFENGEVKFVIFEEHGYINELTIKDIKDAFGDKFSEDKLLIISETVKKINDKKHEEHNIQELQSELGYLNNISVEVVADNFYCRSLYMKYKKGIITKEQLLYGLINTLGQELKRALESNSEYFLKYEFFPELEKEEGDSDNEET